MAVNPKSGKVYVSNTDAHNDVRFEGHTPGFTSVVGDEVDSRISVIDPAAGTVTGDNLNSHLTHTQGRPDGSGDPTLSLAFPEDLAVARDGKSLYVIAQGSASSPSTTPRPSRRARRRRRTPSQVVLSGGGPTGLALDEQASLAFVLTRFDDGISIVDTGSRKEVGHVQMFNPEPASVTAGRQYLYNATLTSALGDQACASCHIGGDFDGLAWDLGNPGTIPLPITTLAAATRSTRRSRRPLRPSWPRSGDPHVPTYDVEALIGTQEAEYIFGLYQPVQGPDDDAEPARPRQPGRDALARRPQRRDPADRHSVPRRQRQPGRLGAAELRHLRRVQRVQVVQRRVPRPGRRRRRSSATRT